MKKFNNFIALGHHVNLSKEEKVKAASLQLKQDIFIENLSQLTKKQIHDIIPDNKMDQLDYIFLHKKDALFKECLIEESVTWLSSSHYTFLLCYTITIENTGEVIELRYANSIYTDGIPLNIEIEIPDTYLKKSFFEKATINQFSEKSLDLIKLYFSLFNNSCDIENHNRKHYMHKRNKIICSEDLRYRIYYEFFICNKRFGYVEKTIATTDDSFNEKLGNFLEKEYTLPILDKKIVDLTDADITVLRMNLI